MKPDTPIYFHYPTLKVIAICDNLITPSFWATKWKWVSQGQLRAETLVAVVRAQHQDIVPEVAGGGARREFEAGAGAV